MGFFVDELLIKITRGVKFLDENTEERNWKGKQSQEWL